MNWQSHSRTLAAAAGAFSICIGTGTCLASPPGYFLTGLASDAPSGAISIVGGLSYSGTATGYTVDSYYARGFIYTPNSGRFDLPALLENETSSVTAIGISGDAETVVGYAASSATQYVVQAFQYTPGRSIQLLPTIGSRPTTSQARSASHDGETIVGTSGGEAAFWRNGTGYQLPAVGGFGRGGIAYDVDSAGLTAVGATSFGLVTQEYPVAVKWSLETQTVTRLSSYFDDPLEYSSANGISGDGRTIVGEATPFFGNDRAIRWDENGVAHSLGTLPGSFSDEAWGVSHDGSVIVGSSRFGNDWRAFIWMEDTGMMLLDDYINSLGFTLPTGWYSERGRAVSGDGLTFAGRARGPNGQAQGFVVTIPNPASLGLLAASLLVFPRRRSR